MADVTVKMGVSGVQQFKSGITDAQASVKTFDAALKANEKQLKATGNAENYMQAQTTLLNGKLKEQEKIAKNAEQALKQMEANGVKTTSKSYQDMQRKLIEAQSAMLDTQMELDGLGTKAADATGKTDKLGDSLGGLNKKISLDQVISVVGKLSSGMENAAKKAVQLGEDLWNSIMDSARWADDTATMAQMYGIDLDTF
jgi:chromosome segregation ATPase